MLKKLLKHELIRDFKFLSIYYVIALVIAILCRIFSYIEGSFVFEIIGKVFVGAAISMVFTILINNIMRSWAFFKTNLYGDQSYLIHTLPVKRGQIYLSKLLASIITLFTSFAVCFVVLIIAFYSKELMQAIEMLFVPLEQAYDISGWALIIGLFVLIFVEVLNMVQCGFAGLILGHRMLRAKVGFSVLFGFVIYYAESAVMLGVTFLFSLASDEMKNLFITQNMVDPQTLKLIFVIAIIEYLALNVVMALISSKLFKKGVNVD